MERLIGFQMRDYYNNLFDIENLYPVDSKTKDFPKPVQEIIALIKENQSNLAKKKAKNYIDQGYEYKELKYLYFSLIIKDLIFKESDLSPKNSALLELSSYLQIPIDSLKRKLISKIPLSQEWKIKNPSNEKELIDFYSTTTSLIYDLMASNHIIQNLYSYFILLEKLKYLKIKKILDYGAGIGTNCLIFKQKGYEPIYSDLPGQHFNFAKWRFRNRSLNIPMINLKNSNINDTFCDVIICTDVLEKTHSPLNILELFKKKLRPGKILILSQDFENKSNSPANLERNKIYSGESFKKLMQDLGFHQIRKDPYIPQMIFQKF